jgi:hypothetical protein
MIHTPYLRYPGSRPRADPCRDSPPYCAEGENVRKDPTASGRIPA